MSFYFIVSTFENLKQIHLSEPGDCKLYNDGVCWFRLCDGCVLIPKSLRGGRIHDEFTSKEAMDDSTTKKDIDADEQGDSNDWLELVKQETNSIRPPAKLEVSE